jgi:hypothetical protein
LIEPIFRYNKDFSCKVKRFFLPETFFVAHDCILLNNVPQKSFAEKFWLDGDLLVFSFFRRKYISLKSKITSLEEFRKLTFFLKKKDSA